jgi:hypothetical protein
VKPLPLRFKQANLPEAFRRSEEHRQASAQYLSLRSTHPARWLYDAACCKQRARQNPVVGIMSCAAW